MTVSGTPICCVIILTSMKVEAQNVLGLQSWAEVEGDLVNNAGNNSHGINKYFPHGPTCTYNSRDIPTYVTCSKSGSITPKILADIMPYLDQNAGFDRTEATPFLLLDGHQKDGEEAVVDEQERMNGGWGGAEGFMVQSE